MDLVNKASQQVIVADEGAYELDNPKSLINLLPGSLQESLQRIKNHFLSELPPESIRKNISHMKEYKQVNMVRMSFWREYDFAIQSKSKMRMTRIWQDVCFTSSEFYNLFKRDEFAAYIFTRPPKKEARERALLEMCYEQIEGIITADHMNKDGTLNPFIAKIKVDIWDKLNDRVHGGAIKRVSVQSEVKNTNINVDATASAMASMNKVSDLRERLKELKEKTSDIETEGYIIDDDPDAFTE